MDDLEIATKRRGDRRQRGYRPMLHNFSPQWFIVTMGTGIVSILLFVFPYEASWLYWLSVVVLAVHTFLVCLFTALSILRCLVWPQIFTAMLRHPVEGSYLGALPVSLLALANMISSICAPAWGSWAAYVAWILWIFSAVLALIIAIYIPWQHVRDVTRVPSSSNMLSALGNLTGVYLLPSIATIVASTSGATVAQALPSTQQTTGTVLTGYILWGIGVPFSAVLLTLYLARLLLLSLPTPDLIMSGFITIGPLNMGAAGILMLGNVARTSFSATNTISDQAGEILYTLGLVVAVILWAFSLLWLFFAIAGVWRYRPPIRMLWTRRLNSISDPDSYPNSTTTTTTANSTTPDTSTAKGVPFNLSWWSTIFPLGTMALSCNRIASVLPSACFRVIAAALSTLVFLLLILMTALTLKDLFLHRGANVLKSLAVEGLKKRAQEDGHQDEIEENEEKAASDQRERIDTTGAYHRPSSGFDRIHEQLQDEDKDEDGNRVQQEEEEEEEEERTLTAVDSSE